jgi:hypothetical protein
MDDGGVDSCVYLDMCYFHEQDGSGDGGRGSNGS